MDLLVTEPLTPKERAEQIVKQLEDDCGKHDHRHRQNLAWVVAMLKSDRSAALKAERERILGEFLSGVMYHYNDIAAAIRKGSDG